MKLTGWSRYILQKRKAARHERSTDFLERQGYQIATIGRGFDAALVATHEGKPTYSSKVYGSGGGQVLRAWTPV